MHDLLAGEEDDRGSRQLAALPEIEALGEVLQALEPIRPSGIGYLDAIVEPVHERRKFDSQSAHACARD